MTSEDHIKAAVVSEMTDHARDVEPLTYAEDHDMGDAEIQRAVQLQRTASVTVTFGADHITIPRPHVPHGPQGVPTHEADAQYLYDAARKIRDFYKPFGSNLRATIVKLIEDAADAIEATGEQHDSK